MPEMISDLPVILQHWLNEKFNGRFSVVRQAIDNSGCLMYNEQSALGLTTPIHIGEVYSTQVEIERWQGDTETTIVLRASDPNFFSDLEYGLRTTWPT